MKTSAGLVNAIYFLDKDYEQLASYESQSTDGLEDHTQTLAENEEVFGVYGVKDVKDHFSSFGFIVKVKPYGSAMMGNKLSNFDPDESSELMGAFDISA